MPSSAVQMEAGAPMSLFLNRAVKRKPDDGSAEAASWDHECGQKVRVVDGCKCLQLVKARNCSGECDRIILITVVTFVCFQENGAGCVKRLCNGLDRQSSANVPWNTPYHLSDCATQNVRTGFSTVWLYDLHFSVSIFSDISKFSLTNLKNLHNFNCLSSFSVKKTYH